RELDDDIGTKAAIVAVERTLFLEIAMFEHAGEFDHPLQLDLAPAAANAGTFERVDQTPRFALEFLANRIERGDALEQAGALLNAAALGSLDLRVHTFDSLCHRREQIFDRLLPGIDV